MAQMPSRGPKLSQGSNWASPTVAESEVNNSMLTIEMPNPMQLVRVRTLPTAWGGALLAVSVENCGESPATVMPQTMSQTHIHGNGADISHGANKQQSPLMLN